MPKEDDFSKGRLRLKREVDMGVFSSITDFVAIARQLKGARIVAVGFHPGMRERGFAIDFRHKRQPTKRFVLGYTETGEWIEFLGERALPEDDLPRGRGGRPLNVDAPSPLTVRVLKSACRMSWSEIAAALGCTSSAAQRAFKRDAEPDERAVWRKIVAEL